MQKDGKALDIYRAEAGREVAEMARKKLPRHCARKDVTQQKKGKLDLENLEAVD